VKTFYVLWTYVANFSRLHEVQGESAEAVAENLLNGFSGDFREKATIYVFDRPPAFTYTPPKKS
jgi:hypothetical protein